MSGHRRERCTACGQSKPVEAFSRDRRRQERRYRRCWCKECERTQKDRAKHAQRLAEMAELEALLKLDSKLSRERIDAEYRYSWFRRKAQADPRFTAIPSESLLEARLRWLLQRTGESHG